VFKGAHAPRDLACPNQLGVAKGRGYSRYVVVETGDREVVTRKLQSFLIVSEVSGCQCVSSHCNESWCCLTCGKIQVNNLTKTLQHTNDV
jgi:hypothetical protein